MRVWKQACDVYVPDRGLRGLNLSRWWDHLHAEWIAETCKVVGVDAPQTFEERVDLAERINTTIYQSIDAVVPGAAASISTLSGAFEMHMASGNPAWFIEVVLQRLEVRQLIGKPFGSDLIGYQKGDERFYPSILEATGARAADVTVVDDGEAPLAVARRLGIRTVKVGGSKDGADLWVEDMSQLPDVLC